MKVVQINATCGSGSTGKICASISELLNKNNITNNIFYSVGISNYSNGIRICNNFYIKVQALYSRFFGNYGFNSFWATKKIIHLLDKLKPDIVHLHNLHSHNCNIGKLLDYLREKNIRVFWTFHDCWAFTAYCPHYTMAKCDYWKTECHDCCQRKYYSWFFDRSRYLYRKKKEAMKGLDLTIITPSQWLANLVKQSFLKDYPVKVINNGIDLTVFKPTESDFRKKNGLIDKKIVLGVAFGWGVRKGLDVFIELAKRLPDDYRIVLVGTNDNVDKQLPANIISIHRTQNQKELAEIYTAADVLANPTREENYPTVNMESLACGTPVVTFRTGGSPEILDETCGSVVDYDDVEMMYSEIRRVCEKKIYPTTACLNRAISFDMNDKFKEYLDVYMELL
ncbi:MAG: glycosyltransferase [Elusimicrobia bacterium]|nr:glycosyltransferase [Elusimicrobiota bacterium]